MTIAALAAGAQAIGGGLQALFSGNKKRERELNEFAKQSPLYTPNKSINDYYQQALNRYAENPYQSQQYQVGARNIQRATAQGLSALQDRRGGIGGASRLAEAQMTGMQNLGAGAEAQRNTRFNQYGQAAQAKTAEDYRAFDINQMTPYNRQLQLKQMAAQAANSRFNAGLGMAGQGLGNLVQLGVADSYANPFSKNKTNVGSVDLPSNNGINNWYGNYGNFSNISSNKFNKYGVPSSSYWNSVINK